MGRSRKKTKIDHNSSLDTKKKNTDPVPTDIVNDILQRLPAKSIAKFVRVSKSWAQIIRSNYFINSFSLRQPMAFQMQQESQRLLFAFNELDVSESQDNWSFFSSSTSVNVATNHKKPQVEFISRLVSQIDGRSGSPIYLKGLLNFIFGRTQVISNPSTGKSIVLPIVKSRGEILSRFFGFDPINGEYKVLCIINPMYGGGHRVRIPPSQNQILTLGSNSSLWREIDVWIPHRPHHFKGVCIDGVIYYLAYEGLGSLQLILVRFDVRSEKFLNQLPCGFLQPFGRRYSLSLINYESKLAIVHKKTESRSFDLWILEDIEKVEWSKISHDVSLFNRYDIEILSVTPSGENIYTCYGRYKYSSFFVMYHDHQKNQHRTVQINKSRSNSTSVVKVDGFIDYVESVMLL